MAKVLIIGAGPAGISAALYARRSGADVTVVTKGAGTGVLAKAEKIEASDEEIEAEIQKVADQYGMKIEDLKKKVTDEEKKSISEDLKYNKAVDFVMENIKARAKAKKKATKKDDESKKDAE